MSTAKPYPIESYAELVAAIHALPDAQQRQVLSMRYEHSMSDVSIAGALGITVSEVELLFIRAYDALRPKLEPFAP
jgi:DNA-directed RNA polymerase specialized sigma24 family protein